MKTTQPQGNDEGMSPVQTLEAENERLRQLLQEAQETLDAIRSGAVDALVVEEVDGNRIYTLEGAERPYRLFVEEMEQGAASLHQDGTIVWCNKQLGRLLKMEPENLLGRGLREFVSEESHTVFDNLLWQGQRRSGRGEAQLLRSDLARFPTFLTFNALPQDCGANIGVLVTDLTPQRLHEQLNAAHQALRESQSQLKLVTDVLPVYIAHCDPETRYKFVNKQYAQRFGLSIRDCVGKRMAEVIGEEAALTLAPHVERVLRGKSVHFEVELPYSRIGSHYMSCSYEPEWDSRGKVVGFIAAISDITERRLMEKALRESQVQSERQRRVYEAILTNTPDFAYVFDLQHRFTYLNEGLLKMFGRTREEAIGKTFSELGYPEWHAEMHRREIDQVVSTRQPVRGEVPFTGTYGKRIYDYIFVPVFGAQGEVEAVAGTTRDITERELADETRARLAAIIEFSDDAIISKTLEGVVTSWNAGAERLLGYSSEEMVGRSITRIIPPGRRGEESEILARIRREEKVNHFETIRMSKEGRLIEVSLSISPIRDSSGKVVGASKIMRDITDRKRAEQALKTAQHQLQEHAEKLEARVAERTSELQSTNNQLEAFVYSIAHDLRAPLRAMQGFSELLLKQAGPPLAESGRDLAHRISQSAMFMDALLQDLLVFSQTAQQRIEWNAVSLDRVVKSVVTRLEKEMQRKGVQLEFQGPWPEVVGHETTLEQVLFNLLTNALKFLRPGVTPQLRIRSQEWVSMERYVPSRDTPTKSDQWVRVWVEDNGIGIAADHREQIFRLFVRLNGKAYPGTGVGLAIVQKGIERMGGQVGVESELGRGSRFWFDLRKAP